MDEIKPEKKRKYYYDAIIIVINAACKSLPDYSLRTLIRSVKNYLNKLEGDLK